MFGLKFNVEDKNLACVEAKKGLKCKSNIPKFNKPTSITHFVGMCIESSIYASKVHKKLYSIIKQHPSNFMFKFLNLLVNNKNLPLLCDA